MKITKVQAREIYDSRGWPTIQCEITLDEQHTVTSSVPAGLSRGSHEARELRDGGKRLWGKGVIKAIENIEQVIAPEIIGKEPEALDLDQKIIELDGTPDKSNLGANATLATSMALYKAQAFNEELELFELIAHLSGNDSVSLPFPFINLINGGLHAQNNLQIQEFMIVPMGSYNFRESMEVATTAFHELKNMLQRYGKSTAVGDEGGFSPLDTDDTQALDILTELLEKLEVTYGNQCVIAIDVAASRFFNPATQTYTINSKSLSAHDLMSWYEDLITTYPIFSIEDGLGEDDWINWERMTKEFGNRIQIVGDDIFATNIARIEEGIKRQTATSVIIKPNQIGTITETLYAIKFCKLHEMNVIVSHRSGETEDTFIADLAVGSNAGQIKAGGCSRSERLAKYNRLLTIEDLLMSAPENQEER